MRYSRCLLIAAMLLPTPVSASSFGLANGSFEAGLSGWDVVVPYYTSPFYAEPIPAGTIGVVSNFGPSNSSGQTRSAFDSAAMALVGSQDAGGIDVADSGPWSIGLRQTVRFEAGEYLSGRAFFYNGDYIPQDQAWVHILDATGSVVAVPWFQSSGTNGAGVSVLYGTATPWMQWTWQAPLSGEYTIAIGITTAGDNRYASYAGFDAIGVDEPSSGYLLAIGILAAIAFRSKVPLPARARSGNT